MNMIQDNNQIPMMDRLMRLPEPLKGYYVTIFAAYASKNPAIIKDRSLTVYNNNLYDLFDSLCSISYGVLGKDIIDYTNDRLDTYVTEGVL